jgi:hypothetical protein
MEESPSKKEDKYERISISLHPKILAWAKEEAEKQGIGYQTASQLSRSCKSTKSMISSHNDSSRSRDSSLILAVISTSRLPYLRLSNFKISICAPQHGHHHSHLDTPEFFIAQYPILYPHSSIFTFECQ